MSTITSCAFNCRNDKIAFLFPKLNTEESGKERKMLSNHLFFVISSLECGFISTRSGVLVPIDHCNLKLANHGESGTPPLSYSFLVQAGNVGSFKKCYKS